MKLKTLLATVALCSMAFGSWAVEPLQSPLFLTSAVDPRVMLVLSRDHELSKKAYTDYTDLDGDGVLDTTYNDTIDYYGYFDANKCYTYASNRFEPAALAVGTNKHHCSGQWSGNFLNWATMTRMDVLRKTLYGGYRSTDGSETVLERHFLPVDVHAFVKVFNPNNNATLQLYVPSSVVDTNTAISLCNVTDTIDTTLTGKMSFPLPAPLIKVASSAWPQWDSSEVTQCAVDIGNSTQPAALIGSYNARVKVCDSTAGLESNCKAYTHPSTLVQNIKPIGLLQEYGDADVSRRTQFGLMTGSYAANKSGGVLRKNIGPIANNNSLAGASACGTNNSNDEIDVCTGQFINQDSAQAGIINTLNRLRIAGFQYKSDGRNDNHRYKCDSPGKLSFNNGDCVDWGNPLSEIYLETLRYYANVGATSAFDKSDETILSSIPKVTWTDPLPTEEWCALSNIIVLSTGLNSFDTDELTSFATSGGTTINAATLTETIGNSSNENINGNSFLIGDNGGSVGVGQCTAKTVANLASAKGICPEMPSTQGGYGIAGLAYAPKTIDIRPEYSSLRNTRWGSIKKDWALRQPITTYAVQLAESLPSFSPVSGVTLLPACQAYSGDPGAEWSDTATGWRNCSMTNLIVDPNVVQDSVGSDSSAKTNTCSGNGTTSQCFTIAWEDSTWGNDYDMDGIQRLGYCVGAACSSFKMLCPSTALKNDTIGPWTAANDEIVVATCAVQANAGHTLTFGFTTAGTNFSGISADGPHFPIYRKGKKNFNVGNKLPDDGVTAASTKLFTANPSSAKLLKNPLWYAAKYGGFSESTPALGTPAPNVTSEWDAKNNLTGAPGADGIPDSFFDVRNPAQLYDRLADVFDRAAVKESSSSSVATNSTRLDTQSVIFQAKFSSEDWSGQLVAYNLNADGSVGSEKWNTDTTLPLGGSRNIKTYDGSKAIGARGVDFTWANLSCTQKGLLSGGSSATVLTNCATATHYDANATGQNRLSWLRGNAVTGMRTRNKALGDIVNSDPVFVKEENFGHFGFIEGDVGAYVDSYSAFLATKKTRQAMIYIGANDGMLHAFNADTGVETFAYIPNAVFKDLHKLTDPAYVHQYYVDGTFGLGDVYYDSGDGGGVKWRTVLIGNLGAGGRAVFALDVTDPANIKVLWEKDYQDADTRWANLGHMSGAPVVTSVTNTLVKSDATVSPWSVVFGNGYNSTAQKAMLFIVNLKTGAIGDLIDTESGSSANGLSNPAIYLARISGRQANIVGEDDGDAIYAGDLLGNLWKFNSCNSGCVWGVAYKKAPLFRATDGANAQPITSPLEIGVAPTGKTGVMVYFGTGRYFASGDQTSKTVQSLYGIWDSGSRIASINRSELVQQTIDAQFTHNGKEVRTVSQNAVTYTDSGGSKVLGWYIDLKDPTSATENGERSVSAPLLRHGRVIFTTLVPSVSDCSYGGNSWIMEMNALTGGRLDYSVFDMNEDKLFNELDYVDHDDNVNTPKIAVSGIRLDTGIAKTPAVLSAGETEYKITSGTSGAILVTREKGMTGAPRTSWREIRDE